MTATEHIPASALPCVRRIACPICAWHKYVPSGWPADVCLDCAANPHVSTQLQYVCDQAMERSAVAVSAYEDAYAAASDDARATMARLIALREAITDDATKQVFLTAWQEAQTVDGLPLLAAAWKVRTATENACAELLSHNLPRLNTLLAAIKALETL